MREKVLIFAAIGMILAACSVTLMSTKIKRSEEVQLKVEEASDSTTLVDLDQDLNLKRILNSKDSVK